jgi:hemerythrin-like metal-binding protein/PAS domain S-box-containing protein
MQLLAWNDYLRTGIDIVDQQHRGLVDLANETAEKLTSGKGLSIDEMRTLLGFLTDYAVTHFSTEEALMALSGIDERHVNHHRQSHLGFLQQVNAMVAELGSEGGLTGFQLMEFLGNWLIYHMLGEDQKMSQLLRGGASVQASETPTAEGSGELQAPARDAANRSLAKLYAFMESRNEQLQVSGQVQRKRSNQMLELVAEQTAELAASEERFRALFHHGALPTLLVRLEANLMPGRIVDANPAASELLGYAQPELLSLSPLDFVAPEEVARFPLIISELLVTGRFDCEMAFTAKEGRRLTTQMNITQFVMHGQPVAMVIFQEISAERAAELARADVQHQAKHLARIRSGFLAAGGPPAGRPDEAPAARSADATVPSGIAACLAEHPLFRQVSAAELARLVAASRLRRLQKAELLFDKGDPAAALFLVVSGQIMLAISSPHGERKVLEIFGRQQSIGEAEIVMNSRYAYFAEAVDEAEVLEVELAAVLALLDKDRNFARDLMQRMGSRQLALVHDVESYTLRSGAERVIGYLLQHANTHAHGRLEVELPATKQLIASLLHIKPETLSRIFRDLSQSGLIQVKARHVHIPDVDRLVAYQSSESEANG